MCNGLLLTVQESKLLELEWEQTNTKQQIEEEKASHGDTLRLLELEKASHEETKNACPNAQGNKIETEIH